MIGSGNFDFRTNQMSACCDCATVEVGTRCPPHPALSLRERENRCLLLENCTTHLIAREQRSLLDHANDLIFANRSVEPAVFTDESIISQNKISVAAENHELVHIVGSESLSTAGKVRLDEQAAINEDFAILEFEGIQGHTDDAFDREVRMAWISDDDQIAALGFSKLVSPSIEQKPISIVQGGNHALAFDHHGRDHIATHHKVSEGGKRYH
jgi:hypothetical protein